jgi:hypothetical protein
MGLKKKKETKVMALSFSKNEQRVAREANRRNSNPGTARLQGLKNVTGKRYHRQDSDARFIFSTDR